MGLQTFHTVSSLALCIRLSKLEQLITVFNRFCCNSTVIHPPHTHKQCQDILVAMVDMH